MKIKKNDTVKILKGKDQGKTGKVLNVLVPSKSVKTRSGKDIQIVIEGLNLKYKHLRPKKSGEKGQRIMFPAPINISNVMLICPKCSKNTRVGYEIKDGVKNRICKKCKAQIS